MVKSKYKNTCHQEISWYLNQKDQQLVMAKAPNSERCFSVIHYQTICTNTLLSFNRDSLSYSNKWCGGWRICIDCDEHGEVKPL